MYRPRKECGPPAQESIACILSSPFLGFMFWDTLIPFGVMTSSQKHSRPWFHPPVSCSVKFHFQNFYHLIQMGFSSKRSPATKHTCLQNASDISFYWEIRNVDWKWCVCHSLHHLSSTSPYVNWLGWDGSNFTYLEDSKNLAAPSPTSDMCSRPLCKDAPDPQGFLFRGGLGPITGWWLNQPIWKKLSTTLFHSP